MTDAHADVAGREHEILTALGIHWRPSARKHINCPFPDHEDKHPSWRWDDDKRRWFCTCGDGSIFDAVIRKRGGDFKSAAAWARDVLLSPVINERPQQVTSTTMNNSVAQGNSSVNIHNAYPHECA